MSAPAPMLTRAAHAYPARDPYGELVGLALRVGGRWEALCCSAGPHRHQVLRTSWATEYRARVVLAAHLARHHGAVVPTTALRISHPRLCRMCTAGEIFFDEFPEPDPDDPAPGLILDMLLDGECPACGGAGVIYSDGPCPTGLEVRSIGAGPR